MANARLQLLQAYEYAEETVELFSEYTAMLIEGDPGIKNRRFADSADHFRCKENWLLLHPFGYSAIFAECNSYVQKVRIL